MLSSRLLTRASLAPKISIYKEFIYKTNYTIYKELKWNVV